MQNEYKKLQDLLDGYEPEVPQQVWAGVEAGVRKGGGRKVMAWWYYGLSIAASVAILLGLVWMLAAGEKQQQLPANMLQAQTTTPAEVVSPTQENTTPNKLITEPTGTQAVTYTATAAANIATPSRPDSGMIKPANATQQPATLAVTQQENTALAAANNQPTTSQTSAVPTQATSSSPTKPVVVTVAAAAQPSRKREIDLNRISFSDVLSFVGNRLNEAFDSPFTAFTETSENRTVRTYELRLGKNVSIKRKQHISAK